MVDYPDSTRPRRAYDRDGSLVFVVDGGTSTPVSDADAAELNTSSADGGVAVSTNEWLAIVFPTLLTIEAMFLAHGGTSNTTVSVESSTNSTDGQDGDWTAEDDIAINRGDTVVSGATWRDDLVTGLDIDAKAIRVSPGTSFWRTWHIHAGGPDQDPAGLVIRDGDFVGILDSILDWRRTPRASSKDREITVVNESAQTALGVVLSIEAAESNDEFATQHYLSTNDRDFTAVLDLGEIAPHSRSTIITVRRVTPENATLGARAARLVAVAASWE